MNVITLPKKEYTDLIRRQMRVEKEVALLQQIFREEMREKVIRPSALKRWDRISSNLDKGKGRSFMSLSEMKDWLKKL